MATPLFDALVTKVRNWANRDSDVLPDSLITDFLDYSADYCYNKLRIPPFEFTYTYAPITEATKDETVLTLPPNFTELITFSRTDANGIKHVFNKQFVEKEFSNSLTTKPENSFTYKGNTIEFYPKAEVGDIYELHYYRRLFDLDATYSVNQANIDVGNCVSANEGDAGAVEFPADSGNYYTGLEVYNWLRDDNERVLLWGAFAHTLDYLGEDERALKFFQKQELAVQELNNDEKQRKAKGATVSVTFEVSELL